MPSHFQKKLQPWIDCSDTYFKSLYLPVWERGVQIFLNERMRWLKTAEPQILPFKVQEDLINFITTALKIRSGLMIPFGKSIEEIIHEAPTWTYAVFLSALLIRGFQLVDRNITEKTWEDYVPLEARSWLIGNALIKRSIEQLIKSPELESQRRETERNVLFVVLHKAYSALRQSSMLLENGALLWYQEEEKSEVKVSCPTEESSVKQEINMAERLLNWVKQQPSETIKMHTIRLPEGLFIAENWVDMFAELQKPKISTKALIERMKNFCIEEDESFMHSYQYQERRKKTRLNGIVIANQYLPTYWKKRNIQSEFIKSF